MAHKVSSTLLLAFFLLVFVVTRASSLDNFNFTRVFSSLENITNNDEIIFSEVNPFKMSAGEYKMIYWSSNISDIHKINVYVDDEFVSYITHREENASDCSINGQLNMTGNMVGYNTIHIELLGNEGKIIANGSLPVSILLKEQKLHQFYIISVAIINIIIFTNMGANLDLSQVKEILKKPIGPAVGIFCQYVCMPLLTYCLGLIFFPDEPLFRLGLFAGGCSPGGGMSNLWVHLLGGSLDLSMMMTFFSVIFALGAIPFWILTLGRAILDNSYVIPYTNVILGIFALVVPSFFGILIQLKSPRLTKLMTQTITHLSIFNIVYKFFFGVYANFYGFTVTSWKAPVAGICSTFFGHLAGIILALLFRRNRKEAIAISIETSVQNYSVGFVLLKLSLESPAAELAIAVMLWQSLVTIIAYICVLVIKVCYVKCCTKTIFKKKECDDSNAKETKYIQAPSSEGTDGAKSKTLPLLEQQPVRPTYK